MGSKTFFDAAKEYLHARKEVDEKRTELERAKTALSYAENRLMRAKEEVFAAKWITEDSPTRTAVVDKKVVLLVQHGPTKALTLDVVDAECA